ncbi:MAG: hypothetical protein ACLFS6_01585 [Methanomassiliicoccales archaeon]
MRDGGEATVDTDGIHRFGGEEGWEEAFQFGLQDSGNDLSGFMRVGLVPNLHRKNVFCLLLLPDGGAVGMRREVHFDSTELSAGGLVFQSIIPEERWKLMFNGTMPDMTGRRGSRKRTSLLLDFEAGGPVFDHRECGSSFHHVLSEGSYEQVEQLGTISGSVEVAGTDYQVQAVGAKSHSWGVRSPSADMERTWISALLTDGTGFSLTAVRVGEEEVMSGFLLTEGENHPMTDGLMVTRIGDSGEPLGFEVVMNHAEGSEEAKGEVMRSVAMELSHPETVSRVFHSVSKFSMSERSGFGLGEYLVARSGANR